MTYKKVSATSNDGCSLNYSVDGVKLDTDKDFMANVEFPDGMRAEVLVLPISYYERGDYIRTKLMAYFKVHGVTVTVPLEKLKMQV